MVGWLRRLRARIRYGNFDRDLSREMDLHRELTQIDLERRGASREAAQQAAARALGNVTLAREDARSVWVAAWLQSLAQDTRYALAVSGMAGPEGASG
jgi:hypothetical protein